ncbi:MAG: beta-ketoacyl-ACP synthase II, partial [Hyphomicrobiaceae bacterium]
MRGEDEAWITGVGIVSTVGEGAELTHQFLTEESRSGSAPAAATVLAPYPVHALCPVDFAKQIPSRAEQRQMGAWQRIGTHAAGLALADAGAAGNSELLDAMDLNVAAGNGERDTALDARVLEGFRASHDPGRFLNETLTSGLRPTLYLGELSNLLAGNIQIVHKVTGSSRTFKGEEMAGVSAVEDA